MTTERGVHVHSCPKPRTSWRRLGSVWVCTCGQGWVLRVICTYGGSARSWEQWTP